MRGKKKLAVFVLLASFFMNVAQARASMILNEILADPPSGLMGDANNDGIRSGTQDEFVELLNFGTEQADIFGWFITDGVSTRHIFPSDTVLAPHTFLAVFGGGNPILPDIHWQVASTGSLGLNNAGDTVTLFNARSQAIGQVHYGSIGNHDQSITLFPDGDGEEFVLHSSVGQANGTLYSPGTSVDSELSLAFQDQEDTDSNPVIPELPTLMYFMFGWCSIFFIQKWPERGQAPFGF